MSFESRMHDIAEAFANELGVPQDNPCREAFWQGVEDTQNSGLDRGKYMTYDDKETQNAYDIGAYIGAAIWASPHS